MTYDAAFAAYYDRITGHKDYDAEVAALVRLMGEAGADRGARVLDVGCGTGTHAALLSDEGYDVTAIDLSPEMAARAREKASRARVLSGDVAELDDGGFSFCMSLFNVVNCLDSLDALAGFLDAIAARVADGGVLLLECWNPIAVIAEPPTTVERTFEDGGSTITRTVTPYPDFLRQRLDLRYDIRAEGPGGGPADTVSVMHELLLFTPLEIESALRGAGFGEIEVLTALPELRPAGAADRMLAFTARRGAA